MTTDQYIISLLKTRMADIVVRYETEITSLQTNYQLLTERLKELEAKINDFQKEAEIRTPESTD